MRANEFITEIERLVPRNYPGGKDTLLSYYSVEKNARPLPGGSGLLFSVKVVAGFFVVKIWDPTQKPTDVQVRQTILDGAPGRLVGLLTLDPINFPLQGAVQVGSITVDEDYRGQGIGQALYGIVLTILRRPLVAGDSQTPAGQQAWVGLNKIPGVVTKGYFALKNYEITPDKFDADNEAEKNIDTIMGKLGGQYLGQTGGRFRGNYGFEYFAFDVLPNTTGKQLQAHVTTKLSKVYDDRQLAGLYAVWTGSGPLFAVNPS